MSGIVSFFEMAERVIGMKESRTKVLHGNSCYCMRCGVEHRRNDCDYMPFDTLNATWNPKTGELRGEYNLAPIKREGKKIDYRGVFDEGR